MYLPPIIARLLPLFADTTTPLSTPTAPIVATTNIKTFRPIKAHATHPTSQALLWHDASQRHTLQDMRSFDLDSDIDIESITGHDDQQQQQQQLQPIDPPPLVLRTRRITIARPRHLPSPNSLRNLTFHQRSTLLSSVPEWEETEVEAPDVTDRETLRSLAMMSSNAYIEPDTPEWYPLDNWNATTPFGWDKDSDGLRGHIFADDTNSTVVISIKGTSAGVLGSGGPTSKNDKFNNLYNNVSFMYPNASIWLTGHSLGGALSSLIGLSFGVPVVAFESPADRLAAQRLHLPLPPGIPMNRMGITHVYHNADPIPMGVCTGVYSGCYAAGFALESRCHLGESIIYDTVGKKGWAVDVRSHRITEIINRILNEDWEGPPSENTTSEYDDETSLSMPFWSSLWGWPGRRRTGHEGEEEGKPGEPKKKKRNPNAVPEAEPEDDCVDCFRWYVLLARADS
ncbi:hypothetical protein QFC22_000418 [Naganishia vaughanmartiniae]|uniref:Uncharacterized protein n=1 Tax=Naganishia vaughanmartiniae TaxID=1424756 RepID=A0ACC2XQB4_9TREE|nr:hypothetical protein QFC22_000418 [Naganishia vaughanmartiniae]